MRKISYLINALVFVSLLLISNSCGRRPGMNGSLYVPTGNINTETKNFGASHTGYIGDTCEDESGFIRPSYVSFNESLMHVGGVPGYGNCFVKAFLKFDLSEIDTTKIAQGTLTITDTYGIEDYTGYAPMVLYSIPDYMELDFASDFDLDENSGVLIDSDGMEGTHIANFEIPKDKFKQGINSFLLKSLNEGFLFRLAGRIYGDESVRPLLALEVETE